MPATTQREQSMEKSAKPVRRRIAIIDWLMMLLALISVALLGYETWGPVTDAQRQLIVLGDLGFCAIFAVEFIWRWYRQGWQRTFLMRNWYEILGMIPAANPEIRSEEHTSELQSLMRISYAVFCLKKKKKTNEQ